MESVKGLGNLFLGASIVFSGLPFATFERFSWLTNLKFILDSIFDRIRRDFIGPVIRKMWRKDTLKQMEEVILVGDGRCDSPGHSAKYCRYTLMNATSGEVVDTVVIPVTEVANSNAMEKAGFINSVLDLKEDGVNICMISTDTHIQIRKLMRTDPRFTAK